MKPVVATALAVMTIAAGGCNTVVKQTTSPGKPVIVSAMGAYEGSSCTSWEPPVPTVSVHPSHGKLETALGKIPLSYKGHKCDGALLNRWISVYTPKPGFKGQDKLTIKYDYITDDGGGRGTESVDVTIDVK